MPLDNSPRNGSHSSSIAKISCNVIANQNAATAIAGNRRDPQHKIGPAIVIDGGDDTERDAEPGREQQRGEGQLQGGRQALPQVEPDRAVRILAFAEIEAQDLAEIEIQLLDDRPVEAVLVADRLDLLRRRVVAGERRRRVGRHHPDQQKGDDQQSQQRRDRGQHAPEDEAEHS